MNATRWPRITVLTAQFLSDQLERAEPDLYRAMLKTFVGALMGAEADALCGAPYGATAQSRPGREACRSSW